MNRLLLAVVLAANAFSDLVDLESAEEAALLVNRPCFLDPTFIRLVTIQATTSLVIKPQTPLLGTETVRVGVPSDCLGVLLAIMPAASTLVSPIFGQRVPQFGPHRMIIFGAILCAISGFSFAGLHFLPQLAFVLVAGLLRIATGIGHTATATASVSYLNVVYKTNFTMATSIYYNFGTVMAMSVPILSAWLERFGGFPVPFLVLGAVAAMIIAGVAPGLPSDLIPVPVDVSPFHAGAIWRMPRVAAALTMLFAAMASSGLIGVLIPPGLAALGVSDLMVSTVFTLSTLLWTVGSLLAGYMVERMNSVRVMHVANAGAIAALIAMGCAAGPLAVSAAFLAVCFATAVAQTAACCVLVLDARALGDAVIPLATGWKIGGKCFGEAFGNLVGGFLYQLGGRQLVATSFASLSIAMAILYEIGTRSCDLPGEELQVPLLKKEETRLLQRIGSIGRRATRWLLKRRAMVELA